jgi:D-alanyl-D-alanine carboxypeptidase
MLKINSTHKAFMLIFLFLSAYPIFASDKSIEADQDILLDSHIQNIINQDRVRYNLPALSVSIKLPSENYTRNYVSGYDSQSHGNPITSNTLFRIGSITKTFTAAIILQLAEENKLSLNDKLVKWFPQYPKWAHVKIKNLLNHTSGIYNYTRGTSWDNELRNNPNKYWSSAELADIAYQKHDLFDPGEKYSYSNTDYILLGMIIQKATGEPLQQVFNERFNTYHLKNTFYPSSLGYPDYVINKLARGYNRDGTFKYNQDVTLAFNTQADGAIISTPNDIIDWLNQLFLGRIISNKSLTQMMSIVSDNDARPIDLKNFHMKDLSSKTPVIDIGEGLGMGLVYFKDYGFTWAHAGGVAGYESCYTLNPCNGIYIALAYSVKPKQQLIFGKISRDIFKEILKTELVTNHVKTYQQNNVIPDFCYQTQND